MFGFVMDKIVIPMMVVSIIIILGVVIPIKSIQHHRLEAELENCILEHREDDPTCRALIFKYQNRCRYKSTSGVPSYVYYMPFAMRTLPRSK